MTSNNLNLLIIDGNVEGRNADIEACKQAGLRGHFLQADSVELAESILGNSNRSVECILLDYNSSAGDALEDLARLHRDYPYVPVIVTARSGSEIAARNAFRNGAVDYLPKDHIPRISLSEVIGEAIAKAAIQRETKLQREELESFARMVVHDLRAPVVHIANFIDILEEDIAETERAEAAGILRHMRILPHLRHSTKNLLSMIDMLAGYTSVERELSFSDVRLGSVVANAVDMLADEISVKCAVVNIEALPTVRGHPAQLTQLFENLVANSIKFNTSHPPRIDIFARHENWSHQIVVRDNGVGIPPEYAEEIFKPLTRLHGGNEFPGSGLGLATVQRIVQRHGGRIWLEQHDVPGTEIVLEFPGGGDALNHPAQGQRHRVSGDNRSTGGLHG